MKLNDKILAFFIAIALSTSGAFSVSAKVEKKDVSQTINEHFSGEPKESKTLNHKKNSIASLRFVWNDPVNAAAFERNGKFWMVFDRPSSQNVADLKEEAKDLAKEVYTLPHPMGTIIIIEPEDNVKYALRKEGLLWIMDLYTGRPPNFEVKDITIFTQFDSLKNSYLFMPISFAGNIIPILDPDIGDTISIFTTSQLGLGHKSFYRTR